MVCYYNTNRHPELSFLRTSESHIDVDFPAHILKKKTENTQFIVKLNRLLNLAATKYWKIRGKIAINSPRGAKFLHSEAHFTGGKRPISIEIFLFGAGKKSTLSYWCALAVAFENRVAER